tara:strand:+ start:376 stop:780 length:405 start_codon:yes stop_codon:yes gene_type:complete
MSQVLAWAEQNGYWTILTARASLAAGESVSGLDDHLNVFEDESIRAQFLRMWRSVAEAARDIDRIAAFEVLSEPRVRCSSCNRMVRRLPVHRRAPHDITGQWPLGGGRYSQKRFDSSTLRRVRRFMHKIQTHLA